MVSFIAALYILPLQNGYLGGGYENYITAPLFWMRANFDGEHYIQIARLGYQPLEYFFFPIYPLMISLVNWVVGYNLSSFVSIGIVFSVILSFFSLHYLYKLARLDHDIETSRWIIISLLIFPTSFYFQLVYTESLFLFLCVTSFYFARRSKWAIAGILGAIASATRLIGVVMFAALLFEWFIQWRETKRPNFKGLLSISLIPTGLFLYMIFLFFATSDPLAFYHNVSIFGEQRSDHMVLLPQVFYRYVFRIIPSLSDYWPMTITIFLELATGVSFLLLSVVSFFKQRGSYAIFLIGGYLIPSLSGSFSSFPRYAIVLFPAFMIIGKYLSNSSKAVKIALVTTFTILLSIFSIMFSRGYWIS